MAVRAHAQPTIGVLHTLIVDIDEQSLRYQYMCREGETVPPLATFQKSVEMRDIQGLTAEISQALARCAERAGNDTDLRLWGGKLFDRLIPQELSDTFRRDTRASYLVLYLDPTLSWIPWELLWDGDEFFCRRFWLARLLQKSGAELRAAEERLKEERSGRGSLIVFGDVAGLDASDERVAVEKNLSDIYGTNTWFFKARSAADVLEELKKDYEICHFVGHGEFHADHPSETGWKFSDGSVLTCHDIEAVSSRAAFPLLIFANSCDSARPAIPDAQGYITTLYRSFLRQGVPHYIGTAARVPDNLSKEFALCFYQMLATGSSVGEALGEARRLFSAEPGIPIWAYYIHYGDPTYRFLDRKTRTSGYENAPATGGPKILRDTTSFSVLGRSSNDEIGRTLEHYKSVITKNSADGEAHYALALCHLQLGLPELAIKNFQRTVELMPDCADAYYYYGLALIRGRRPKTLSLAEVRRIEQYLDTALQLDPRQAKYYYLAAILKFDYYLSNGLTCNPSPDAFFLMAQDKEYDPWEVERLLHNVLLRDPDLVSKVRKNHETMKFA